jgi:hypothetical protein
MSRGRGGPEQLVYEVYVQVVPTLCLVLRGTAANNRHYSQRVQRRRQVDDDLFGTQTLHELQVRRRPETRR